MFNEEYQFWIYTSFFIVIVGFSLLFNGIILKFSKTLGIRNKEGTTIRWSSVSKPALGGIGFFIVFLISIACYGILFEADGIFKEPSALALIGSSSLAFLMGLADDAYNTRPLLKFLVQVTCGIILIGAGVYIQTFPYEWMNYAVTIFWVIGIMNSINMLDNMDGITSITSACIIVAILIYMYMMGLSTEFEYIAMLGVLAGLIGFLFYNWHPSKMFMGDTGSQFLGLFLAAVSIKFLWNSKGLEGTIVQSRQIVMVILCFLVPIVDTTVVSINRLRRKQSPFVGGKDHTTHNLSYLGLTDTQVGFIFLGLAALCTFLTAIIIRFLEDWTHLYTLIFTGFAILVLSIFFYITYLNKDKIRKS